MATERAKVETIASMLKPLAQSALTIHERLHHENLTTKELVGRLRKALGEQ
jgi:hypothetical protein